jgi:hypothetical protein
MGYIKKYNESKKSHPVNSTVCYVAHQGVADLSVMFDDIHALIRWPETGLSLYEKIQGIKYKKPILTEDPWFISCYDNNDVYVWVNGEWVNPDRQTYGTSVNIIMSSILKVSSTIPLNVLGDRKDLEKIKNIYVNK